MAKKINYANLYTLRKDGRYVGTYTDSTGKRHHVYDCDPKKLYYKIEEAQKPKVLSFKDIAEAWHDEHWKRISDGTKACYTASYKRALEEQEDKYAIKVSTADISKHLEKLKRQNLGSKTIKTQRTIYKLIYQFAINNDYFGKSITTNPAINVPLPKGLKSIKREAPPDEVIDKIRTNAATAYWGLFAMFLICTGLRRGEALAITWGDIDYKNNNITVNKAVKFRGTAKIGDVKSSAGYRTVPLLPDIKAILKKPAGAKADDYVFPGESGKFMCESTYRRRWKHYCKDLGFVTVTEEKRKNKAGKEYVHRDYKPTLTAHVMRHGYATMLFEAGVDVYTAQKLLGHADIKTTMAVYTHLRERKEKDSIGKLNAYITNNYKPMLSNKLSDDAQSIENA